jgi:hypothetical protein
MHGEYVKPRKSTYLNETYLNVKICFILFFYSRILELKSISLCCPFN